MHDDIVARLRGAADRKYGCGCVKCDAADEIERLRVQALGTQRRIQDQDAIMAELWERIHALTTERDEARREVCEMLERDAGFSAQRQAASRGWDCFHDKAARRSTAPTPANTGGGADHQIPEAL